MNTRILNKCIAELKKEDPKIDYVLGMLEVLAEAPDAPVVVQRQEEHEVRPAQKLVAEAGFTAQGAVKTLDDPAGDLETPEERIARIGKPKVPPAFLSDMRKMMIDPSKQA